MPLLLARRSFLTGAAAAIAAQSFPVVETSAPYVDNAGANPKPVTMPAGVVSGDLLSMFFSGISAPSAVPTGWTQVYGFGGGGSAPPSRLYVRQSDGTEGATVNLAAASRGAAITYRISGHNGIAGVEAATLNGLGVGSATPDPPNLAPSWGSKKTLWLTVAHIRDQNVTLTSLPTDYASAVAAVVTGGTGTSMHSGHRALEASSEDPGVFTISASKLYGVSTVAIEPA